MDKEKLMEAVEKIMTDNYNKFTGTNEAELHIREDIADFIESIANGAYGEGYKDPTSQAVHEIREQYHPNH